VYVHGSPLQHPSADLYVSIQFQSPVISNFNTVACSGHGEAYLFMKTNHVWCFHRLTLGVVKSSMEIID